MKRITTLLTTATALLLLPALALTDESTTLTLEAAIRAGDVDAAITALDSGEEPDIKAASGAPMLVLAASLNASKIVEALLANGAAVNATASGEATALMYASGANNAAMAQLLLEAGADIDMRDAQGDPAINWGSYYGSLAYIQVLLKHNPDTSLRGHGNAFEIALRRGHEETVQAIAAYNGTVSDHPEAGLDRIGRPLLHQAAMSEDVATISSYLAKGISPDIEDDIGFTALMHAAREGAMDSAKMLVANGADVNHEGSDYGLALTPLHLAAIGNQTEVVRFLIDNGAHLDTQGVTEQTPLAWGLFEGSLESAVVLLEAGADWQIGPEAGPNLRDVAESQGWTEIVELMGR